MSNPYPDVAPRPDHAAPPTRPIIVAAVVAVTVALLGAPLGWLWAAVAPRLAVIKVDGGFIYAEAEPEQPIAADGWFALLGAGTGLLVVFAVWILLRRYRGVLMLLAAVLGSLAAGCAAWWVGTKIGVAGFADVRDSAAVGTRLDGPLGLRITDLDRDQLWPFLPTGVVAVQALVTAFAYTCLAGFSAHGNLRSADPHVNPWPPVDLSEGQRGAEPRPDVATDHHGPVPASPDQSGPASAGPDRSGPQQSGPQQNRSGQSGSVSSGQA